MRNRSISACLTALLCLCLSASAQSPDTLSLSHRLPVLNGKASFAFPSMAADVRRAVDIMAADPNANEETRIVFDMGDMRMVFFAQELFALSDAGLVSTITRQNEPQGFRSRVIADRDSMLAILSVPDRHDSTKDAILIGSLMVRAADNTLFRVDAYINRPAYHLHRAYETLMEKVFGSVAKGDRRTDLGARKEKLALFDAGRDIIFDLPANYSITTDQQYDFQVFKLHKYQLLTDTSWIQLLIYNGDHPSPLYRDYNLRESDAKKVDGEFLGKKINWLFFDIRDQKIYDKEQVIPAEEIGKGRIMHIAMVSNEKAVLPELTAIIERIRLGDK